MYLEIHSSADWQPVIAPPDCGDIDSVAQVKEKQMNMYQDETISNFRHCSSLSAPACIRSRLFLQCALCSVTLTVNTIQRSVSAVAVPVCSSDASISKISIYRFDIDVSNPVVSAALISIFSIYRHAQFPFMTADFISLDSNAGNKKLVTAGVKSNNNNHHHFICS